VQLYFRRLHFLRLPKEKVDEAWVVSPEINEYLVGFWDIDFMKTYPRANSNVLDNYLAEM
jgi:hypothetical protein